MNLTTQEINRLYRIEFACTMPKLTAANESLILYGTRRGKGATYIFPAGLPGKTLIVTDSKSTTTTTKTCTFTRSHFVNPDQPTLAEIVAAIEAAFHEAAHVTPSASAYGTLVLTAPAATDGVLTLGAGTANELLGFPTMGLSINNATGITITLPAEMAYPDDSLLYAMHPNVRQATLTVATGVLTELFGPAGMAAPVWTPSARTLFLEDGSTDASKAIHCVVEF